MSKRTPLYLVCALAALLGACSSASKIKPAELTTFTQSAALAVKWQAGVGAAGEYALTPAVVGDSVYAAARDGTLVRFDHGKEIWRIAVGRPISGGVGADAKLVVVGTAKAEVLAFSAATGQPAWQARVSSEVLAAPAVAEDMVVVRSGDSHISAFEAKDGKRRWVYQRSIPALALRSGVGVTLVSPRELVAGFPGGKVVAIAANNGAAIWEATVAMPKGSTELERIADVASSVVVDGRQVCAAAYQGRVACFDLSSGNALWSRDLSSNAGIDIDSRYVYVSDDRGAIHALDRNNGTSIWKQDKLANRGLSRPLVLGNHLAVGDAQGYLHLLRRDDGAFAARLATDASAIVAEPQHLDKDFVVQTKSGGLFALGVQ
jgi:outer membrane protein assembly factor BamB